jgi:LPXTG-motif cell wall-anchored protein
MMRKEQSMQSAKQWRLAAASLCIAGFATAVSAQSSVTSTEIKQFEVISVDGNKVVAKTAAGAKEYTLPADFKFTTADGKQLAVQDLKPGMKGTAHVTTTTTTVPVYVTEVKNGEVVQKSGNSIIVRTANGIKMFSEGDMAKRNITIMKDGKPAGISDLSTGDKLSATIVTEGTPRVLTEQQLQARLHPSGAAAGAGAAGAGSGAAASRSSASAGTAPSGAAAPAKKLPKTASNLPLAGLIGALSLAAGLSLTIARKRRNSMF